jgi:hypothetical protein
MSSGMAVTSPPAERKYGIAALLLIEPRARHAEASLSSSYRARLMGADLEWNGLTS